jgi:hypothetical protein
MCTFYGKRLTKVCVDVWGADRVERFVDPGPTIQKLLVIRLPYYNI